MGSGVRDYRRTASIAQCVGVRWIDDGVYTARNGRWRIVRWERPGKPTRWLVTDSTGRFNRGRSLVARTLYDARCAVGAAENTPDGGPPPPAERNGSRPTSPEDT